MGPLCFTATLAIAGIRPFGHDAGAPNWLRSLFAPIIGVAIGGAFSPGIFAELIHWWTTVLALVVYMPLAHISGFLIAHRIMGSTQTRPISAPCQAASSRLVSWPNAPMPIKPWSPRSSFCG
jgi:uncharacterized membrane protein AbrB (regulator of aidB expression)